MSSLKKYRSTLYQTFDSKYAKQLHNIYHNLHTKETIEKFNIFTEDLMDEPFINRFNLLDSIEDYNKTPDGIKFPINPHFYNAAWNFRLMGF